MKWWALYWNLPMDVIVRLPHPRSWNREGRETFLEPSANRQARNYDIECSNYHTSLSTLRPKGFSRSKKKWWEIYTNLPVDVIAWPPHPWSGYSRGREMFLAPSAYKQTRNYHIECSKHHPSLSNLRPKWLRYSKMNSWAIHTNLPVDVTVSLPILAVEVARARKRF